MKVLIVDLEPLRSKLISAVSDASDIQVIGFTSTLDEMVSDYCQAPDVVIVDAQAMNLSEMSNVRTRPAEWLPQIKVLLLTTPEEARNLTPDALRTYMSLGGTGLLFKTGDTTRLEDAIRLVASGGFVCETDLIKRILAPLSEWSTPLGEQENGQ